MKRLDLSNQRYGKLTAIAHVRSNPNNNMSYWLCNCDCGNKTEVTLGNLRSNHTISCGCEKRKTGSEAPNFKHGHAKKSKAWISWMKIKERCFNKNNRSYKDYGAKGILLSESYRSDFISFHNEVGDPPNCGNNYTIDRVDNTKGYIKGNMRWATNKQQAQNKGLPSNNTTGKKGIHWYTTNWTDKSSVTRSCLFAVATWKTTEGKTCNKKFNVNKLGLLPAFAGAFIYRDDKITELNNAGEDYKHYEKGR